MVIQSALRPTAIERFMQIPTMRIELRHSDPVIWRLVEVPTSITLKVLYDIVRVTMGWLDHHLSEMEIEGQTYGPPMEDDWGTVGSRVRLRDVLAPSPTTIEYSYDFGHNWKHSRTLSDVRQGDPAIAYPRFGGERDCRLRIAGDYRLLRDARASR
jgi:hypothetical protein